MRLVGLVNTLGNLGKKFLNRSLGIMTERQIQASTAKVSREFTNKILATSDNLPDDILQSVFTRNLPNGISTPHMTRNPDDVRNFLLNETFISENSLNELNKIAGALTFPSQKGNGSLIYIPQNVNKYLLPNYATHEFRHLIDADYTIKGKIAKIIQKMFPNFVKKAGQKYSDKAQKFYNYTQKVMEDDIVKIFSTRDAKSKHLLEAMNLSETDMQKYLISKLKQGLTGLSYNEKIHLLKIIKLQSKREVVAYMSGVKGEKFLNARISSSNAKQYLSPYEIIAEYEAQLSKAATSLLHQEKIDKIKSLFRIKQS